MKKMILGIMLAVAFCVNANAETYVYTATIAANSTNLSAALPVSGTLHKIEISGFSSTVTGTVTVATYDGTTAVDTIANPGALSANKIIRLLVQPTDNTGTVIPAAYAAGGTGGTNAATVLSVPYIPVMVGGNVKVRCVNDVGNSIPLKVTFYYIREQK